LRKRGERNDTIFIWIIASFLILVCLVIAGLQNNAPLELTFFWWHLQTPLGVMISWAAAAGAAFIGVLSLPKPVKKYLDARRLDKDVQRLERLCARPQGDRKAA
jgi:uncharacterized integral membrane protein